MRNNVHNGDCLSQAIVYVIEIIESSRRGLAYTLPELARPAPTARCDMVACWNARVTGNASLLSFGIVGVPEL